MPFVAESVAAPVSIGEVVAWGLTLLASAAVVHRMRRVEAAGGVVVPGRPWPVAEWSGGDVLLVCGVTMLALVAGASLPGADAPLAEGIAAGAVGFLAAVFAIVAVLRARGASWRSIGLTSFDPVGDLRLALGGLVLVVGPLLVVASALDRLVPYEHPVVDALAAGRTPFAVAAVVLAAVVAAPIAEELLFRRVILGWLDKRFPSPGGSVAILASGLAFGLVHQGQGLAWVPLAVFGVVLGELAFRRGSIVPAILLHALFNGVSVVLLLLQPPGPG